MQFPDARILIFAKAPQPGRVKTRLIPALGEQGAAAFHEACIRHAVQQRCAAALAPVLLYVAPHTGHPVFAELAQRYPIELRIQQGAELGQRMANAARECLDQADWVLLTGSDAPSLSNADLFEAARRLQQGGRAVMSAAEDGGYVMLGLSQPSPSLFVDMPWGSDRVAELTRARCRQQQSALQELAQRWDVDRPEDLFRLSGQGMPADGLSGLSVAQWLALLQALGAGDSA